VLFFHKTPEKVQDFIVTLVVKLPSNSESSIYKLKINMIASHQCTYARRSSRHVCLSTLNLSKHSI